MKALQQWCRDCAAATGSFLCVGCARWRCVRCELADENGPVCTSCMTSHLAD